MTDMALIHAGDRDALLEVIMDQTEEIQEQPDASVTCPCGLETPVFRAYQCFHCDIYLCPGCAEDHFEEGHAPLNEAMESLELAEYGLAHISWQSQAQTSLGHVRDARDALMVHLEEP